MQDTQHNGTSTANSGETIERFRDPIHTVNKFRIDRVEFAEDASVSANRFYALYSEYCWGKNYPRQTKSAVLEWVGKWNVEFVERENETPGTRGEPWTFIEGISVSRGGRA